MHQRLGQHFLINKLAIAETIAALTLQENDLVVEIGPGKGALTMPLAQKCVGFNCKILAIEKDEALVDNLSETLRKYGNSVQIIAGDALEMIPKMDEIASEALAMTGGHWKLVGNIPYYITGNLLRIVGELGNKPGSENSVGEKGEKTEFLLLGKPQIAVLMVQKEVAERITAKPGKMNLLSAATQFWADISIIKRLKTSDFDPPPEVESAIIKIESRMMNNELRGERQQETREEGERYYKTIKIVFKQPRKTLLNNLAGGLGVKKEVILQKIAGFGFNERTRGQELSVEQLLELSKLL